MTSVPPCLCVLYNSHRHHHVVHRSVISSRGHVLNLLHHVESLLHFTEHRVLVVEERRTAHSRISLHLLISEFRSSLLAADSMRLCNQVVLQFLQSRTVAIASEFHNLCLVLSHQSVKHRLLLLHGHLPLHLLQFRWFVGLSPHDIKLASAALPVRVHLVARARCTQCPTLVEELRINKLSRDGIVRSARSQVLSSRSPLRVGVAALNHEVLNHTVEQRSVEITLLRQFHEVITMTRSLVIQAHYDVAQRSLNLNSHYNILLINIV